MVIDWTGLDALTLTQAQWLTRHAAMAVGFLEVRGEVRVRVVGDAQMQAAHQRHLNDPTTTDVLTFDLRSPGEVAAGAPLDVDVMVCHDVAAREASARGHGTERELLLYVVHAVLHCLDHDDLDDRSAQAMHAREDEVLTAIGVGPTFRPSAAALVDSPARTDHPEGR